jgi:hypothetical protein
VGAICLNSAPSPPGPGGGGGGGGAMQNMSHTYASRRSRWRSKGGQTNAQGESGVLDLEYSLLHPPTHYGKTPSNDLVPHIGKGVGGGGKRAARGPKGRVWDSRADVSAERPLGERQVSWDTYHMHL